MAERVLDERADSFRSGQFSGPPSISNFMTGPPGVIAYLEREFGIREPGTIRLMDISRHISDFSTVLGAPAGDILRRHPPIAVALPDSVFDEIAGRLGGDASAMGFFHRGSNAVFVRESLSSDPQRLDSIVRHELSHYLSYLARNGGAPHLMAEMPDGRTAPVTARWLEEGLSDFVCSRMSPDHRTTYRLPAATLELMASVIGERTLLDAFATGNYAALGTAIDRAYGEGAFRELVMANDDPLLAMHILLRRGGLPDERPPSISEPMWADIRMYAENVASFYGPWRRERGPAEN
ncbi:MAG: hypothetical protein AB1324_03600 [Candidatus Micrarchaeota archaeon]